MTSVKKDFRSSRALVRVTGNGQESGQDRDLPRQFSGRIERLNYVLHGEVNGGVLDSGDFLHLKPEAAPVEARDRTKPMRGGRFVIGRHKGNKNHAG
jgi:hypothetical protein